MAGPYATKPRKRRINWRRVKCPVCGNRITNNALGREAHIRHCQGREPAKPKEGAP